ncbi:MAG: DUF5063 domain-containing protein [Sedimenticola sp.]|jgi:hypothetical protein|nr:MAG: DUF5063 domain-containing protein [Sedimenticola sp.]
MSPRFNEMEEVARTYCNLIENVREINAQWLQDLAALLPKLHATVASLGRPITITTHTLMPDMDARFDMYAKLHRLLGEKDGYWMEFDVAHDGQSMTGSLADDLTDIYCELKQGLKLLENEPKRVFDDWINGYRVHWGQHLIDAERHLYTLGTRNKF